MSASEELNIPGSPDCQHFTTQSQQPTEDQHGHSNSRDTTAIDKHAVKIGPEKPGQETSSLRLRLTSSANSVKQDPISEQEQSKGQSSNMVTPNPILPSVIGPSPQTLPASAFTLPSYSKVFNTLQKSMDNLALRMTHQREDKKFADSRLDKKKEKIQDLKERKSEVEEYLSDKEKKIKGLEREATELQSKLETERMKREEAQDALVKKANKIESLQGFIMQKDMELRRMMEDRQEEHDKLAELEKELKKAKAALEAEKAAKADTEQQFREYSVSFDDIQRGVERLKTMQTTREEKETIMNTVLKWTYEDLEEEQEEEDEIAELKCKLERQKILTKTYRCFVLFLTFLLLCLLLI